LELLTLGHNSYGKSRVRLMKVKRHAGHDSVFEWNIDIKLTGEFHDCFASGDNSRILPTDTMKNTVYSLARSSFTTCIEHFAAELATHFIQNNPFAESATVTICNAPWRHIAVNGLPYPTAFTRSGGENEIVTVTCTKSATLEYVAGIEELAVLKTSKSAFAGFYKDNLTTLKETHDRLFGTLVSAHWKYSNGDHDFPVLRAQAVAALLKAFAEHDSQSVQQTLYAMAGAVLEALPEVSEIHLAMPNKHCNLVDLSPFGQDNPNQIFVPTDEPHGMIDAQLRRAN